MIRRQTQPVLVCPCSVSHRVLAVSLHPDINSGQAGLADIAGQETIAAAGFWHGQGASSQLAVHRSLSEPLGLLHQQVVSLLGLLQPHDDCTGQGQRLKVIRGRLVAHFLEGSN